MTDRKKKRGIIQNIVQLAACSHLRRGILISLNAGKKPLSELRTELEVSYTTAIHALRELEKNNLVFEDKDRDYMLTKIGEIIALKLTDFINVADALKSTKGFGLNTISAVFHRICSRRLDA